MHVDHFHTAEVNAEHLKNIQQLEQELGVVLVAMEADPEPAELNAEQLAMIKTLEEKTGKVIVAYQS
jgi:hypothetical protein